MSLKLKSDTHFQLCTAHSCNYLTVLNWEFSRLLEVIFQKNLMKKNHALVEKLKIFTKFTSLERKEIS